jgi:hypothetical protein
MISNIRCSNQAKAKRAKFSSEEDSFLIDLVKEHGSKNWKVISSLMKHRTPRQCKDRWEGFLSTNIVKRLWSTEEDVLLIEKIAEFGKK